MAKHERREGGRIPRFEMDFKKEIIAKYGHMTKKKKTYNEFCRFIEKEFKGEKISFDLLSDTMKYFLFYNISMYNKTHGIDLTKDEIDIDVYIIPNEGRGRRYYEEDYVYSSIKGYREFIYVLLVKQLEYYMESNSGILFTDLAVERGISDKEKEKESVLYIEYLSRIDAQVNEENYKKGIIN